MLNYVNNNSQPKIHFVDRRGISVMYGCL